MSTIGPDPVTGATTVIEEDHRIIHDKRAFTSAYPEVLGKNEALDFVFKVPVGVSAHVRGWQVSCQRNKEMEFRIFEGTVSSGGMPWPGYNNHREGPPPIAFVRINPVITDIGDQIDYLPVTEISTEHVLGSEWVLRPETEYTFQIFNPKAKASCAMRVFWYEPGDYNVDL